MKFAKWVFLIAGIYGLVVFVPMYFLENTITQQSSSPITHPEFFYGFVGLGIAWQVLFLVISRDPVRLRIAMLPSVIEKLSFGIPCLVLYSANRVTLGTTLLACVDFVFAVLFVVGFLKTSQSVAAR